MFCQQQKSLTGLQYLMRCACSPATSLMQAHHISSAVTGRGITAGEALNAVLSRISPALSECHPSSTNCQHASQPSVQHHHGSLGPCDAADLGGEHNDYDRPAEQSCERDHTHKEKLGKLYRCDVHQTRQDRGCPALC